MTRVESAESYPLTSIRGFREHGQLPQNLQGTGLGNTGNRQHQSVIAVQFGIACNETASFAAQLLYAMLKIVLMTLPLPQHQCRKSLAAAQSMGPIVLLRVHHA